MAGRTPHSCWLVVFSCCRLPGNHPWITVATKTFDSWFRIDSITIPTYCDHLTVLVTIAQQLEAPWQQEMKCQGEAMLDRTGHRISMGKGKLAAGTQGFPGKFKREANILWWVAQARIRCSTWHRFCQVIYLKVSHSLLVIIDCNHRLGYDCYMIYALVLKHGNRQTAKN